MWRWPLTPFYCRGQERVEPLGLYRASVTVLYKGALFFLFLQNTPCDIVGCCVNGHVTWRADLAWFHLYGCPTSDLLTFIFAALKGEWHMRGGNMCYCPGLREPDIYWTLACIKTMHYRTCTDKHAGSDDWNARSTLTTMIRLFVLNLFHNASQHWGEAAFAGDIAPTACSSIGC